MKFITLAPFVAVATQGLDGLGDVAPRGEYPAVAKALDDYTVLIPDRPGNNRLDNYSNILENPKVSLLFHRAPPMAR